MARRLRRFCAKWGRASTTRTAAPASTSARPAIPEFWRSAPLEDCELPLATPSRRPSRVSRDYYYALLERRVFKSYAVYHPDREPPVWYRGPFEHSGPVATLEDWFARRRLGDDLRAHGFQGRRHRHTLGARASVRTDAAGRGQGRAHRVPEDPVAATSSQPAGTRCRGSGSWTSPCS